MGKRPNASLATATLSAGSGEIDAVEGVALAIARVGARAHGSPIRHLSFDLLTVNDEEWQFFV